MPHCPSLPSAPFRGWCCLRQQPKSYGQTVHLPAVLKLKPFCHLPVLISKKVYFSILDEQSLSWWMQFATFCNIELFKNALISPCFKCDSLVSEQELLSWPRTLSSPCQGSGSKARSSSQQEDLIKAAFNISVTLVPPESNRGTEAYDW